MHLNGLLIITIALRIVCTTLSGIMWFKLVWLNLLIEMRCMSNWFGLTYRSALYI